ncbi:hypothetical protein [Photorhabdus laumondii]|uniref:hypothetical protein n=1 Tax=Photorhabdus laumondii TaxID=2218628 RepID=UPI001F4DEAD5|nr:hypothetical protein [Photorhabdus laumondii]
MGLVLCTGLRPFNFKGFVEAKSALDYLAAAVAIIPGAGDAAGKTIKAVEKALHKGDIGEASKLLNKASDEITSVSRPSHRKSEIDVGKDLGDGMVRLHLKRVRKSPMELKAVFVQTGVRAIFVVLK